MITGTQCRAARALISWSLDQLAEAAGCSRGSIIHFEHGSNGLKKSTIELIITAFAQQKIEFIDQLGVTQSTYSLKLLTGQDIQLQLWRDILTTLYRDGGDVFIHHDPDKLLGETGTLPTTEYIKCHFSQRVAEELLTSRDDNLADKMAASKCHWIGSGDRMFFPTYAYGKDKVALNVSDKGGVLCEDLDLSPIIRRQFE